MNYSEVEYYGIRTEDETLVEEGVSLLPQLGPALFGSILHVAQAHGLTLAQTKVILQVATYGQMTMGEIACRLNVSLPATSEIVDRLVDAGHLVRAIDPADRRRVLVAATESSAPIAEELSELRRVQLRYALGLLPPEERPIFLRSLHALITGLTADERVAPADCHVSTLASANRDP